MTPPKITLYLDGPEDDKAAMEMAMASLLDLSAYLETLMRRRKGVELRVMLVRILDTPNQWKAMVHLDDSPLADED